ncbi:MAG TPA: ribonucleoside-diphosphate reductase subunit alpha, partial [Spirochaetia bacterium]|nr:ribonucleoside-diphosphate reductase subunit alpha [Spirochaetia bacterium]
MAVTQVKKRDGRVVDFDKERIVRALQKAFAAADVDFASTDFDGIIDSVVAELEREFAEGKPGVEEIQDIVEKSLVRHGVYEVAKSYILYREKRKEARLDRRKESVERARHGELLVTKSHGEEEPFDREKILRSIRFAAGDLEASVSPELILDEALANIYDNVTTENLSRALVLASCSFIERDPGYNYLTARLYLQMLYKEVIGRSTTAENLTQLYRESFAKGVLRGVETEAFDKRLGGFDIARLAQGLHPERDLLFGYIGVHTLYERYFVKFDGRAAELPQGFWMRVAMGLALNEPEKEARALEFYELLSSLRFVSSTPTLFHSGLTHPQLSSCYLSTVKDDLGHIFKSFGDNAQLSKWSGGIGNDWSYIRATGSPIESTKVESQGVIPFLKIANDVTVAINRSGKRRGATCAYLETWHLDIEDFLDLRRNTGDDRRRTHDMNTANWIPDLFMKRVEEDADWTLFSPDETPDLHDLYGRAFEERYTEYERLASEGKIRKFRTISALKLWRKMLTRLFETGHPWITFKDPSNIRSPQDHVGVVHNSNLCTEITLNNSEEETAVCNLGSINLEKHVNDGSIDEELLAATIRSAMRMLDNVIDINYYPTGEARASNLRHRPVGLGIMGFQDALYKTDVAFESEEALDFSDQIMELVSYHAILGSSLLAEERGSYASYPGSKWDRGIFPIDSLELLESERGIPVEVPRGGRLDWTPVRAHVARFGMRNSNTMAIAPTATI